MRPRHSTAWAPRLASLGVALTLGLGLGLGIGMGPAFAEEARIDHVDVGTESLELLVSLPPGVDASTGTVTATIDGVQLIGEVTSAESETVQLRRTAVLALDASNSMAGKKLRAAKAAAQAYLEAIPENVNLGLVTFADKVTTVVAPTRDHDQVAAALEDITTTRGTRLHEGVAEAVATAGSVGARSVLVLSDGADSSETPIRVATLPIERSGAPGNRVHVDAIRLGQDATNRGSLAQIAKAGEGAVLDAGRARALTRIFAAEAELLQQQAVVAFSDISPAQGLQGNLRVAVVADGTEYVDSTLVSFPEIAAPQPAATPADLKTVESGWQIPFLGVVLGGVGAALALTFLLMTVVRGLLPAPADVVSSSIDAYTRQGARRLAAQQAAEGQGSVTSQAVDAAAKVLQSNRGLEVRLGQRLEAAGMQLKAPEWLLIHAAAAVIVTAIFVILSRGNIAGLLIGAVLGLAGPWLFLGFKRSARVKAFKAQLPDTLQLMAGSLSAGLSLAQSVDTVVREGADPIAAEFRRALVETRLGVEIEEALSGIAERMGSKDFAWVVMAIRIQREVGGNLSELLNKVAETIREREYLERQVLTLSAEGRLSVWILGGLPPVFIAYLALTSPDYLEPLISTPLGIAMLVLMTILEVVGVVWMKSVVKVEV